MNCIFYSGQSFIGSLVTIEINLCCLKVKVLVAQSCPTLCDPMDICQDPLSMEFSRQGYRVGCHSLLQRIFPTQGSNLGLLH